MASINTSSWHDVPINPGPNQEDLESSTQSHLQSQPHLGIGEALATKLAIDALEHYERTKAVSLFARADRIARRDLPFHIFDELDKDLFRGLLKGNVFLQWSDLPDRIHGITHQQGRRSQRVCIELNRVLFVDPALHGGTIIALLLHHMVHAYFLVCCGYKDVAVGDGHNLEHGLGFSTFCHRIMDALHSKPTHTSPNLFNCSSTGSRCSNALPERSVDEKTKSAGSSFCPWRLNVFQTKDTCEDYLKTLQSLSMEVDGGSPLKINPLSHYLHTLSSGKFEPKPILRTRFYSRTSDYIELHYLTYAFPITRTALKKFPSLTDRFSKAENRVLEVPSETSIPVFLALYNFLLNLNYSPSISPVSTLPSTAQASTGPAVIMPFDPNEPLYLLTDIRIFILASRMLFVELQRKALERLYAQRFIKNDPMTVLEEIYAKDTTKSMEHGHELRAWARLFMSSSIDGHKATNFSILQSSSQWSHRFNKLRQQGGDFLEDCDAVQESLTLMHLLANTDITGAETSTMQSKLATYFSTEKSPATASIPRPTGSEDVAVRLLENNLYTSQRSPLLPECLRLLQDSHISPTDSPVMSPEEPKPEQREETLEPSQIKDPRLDNKLSSTTQSPSTDLEEIKGTTSSQKRVEKALSTQISEANTKRRSTHTGAETRAIDWDNPNHEYYYEDPHQNPYARYCVHLLMSQRYFPTSPRIPPFYYQTRRGLPYQRYIMDRLYPSWAGRSGWMGY